MSHTLHLNVRGSFDLLMLICFVLKTPLAGFAFSIVFLFVVSGKSLSLSVLSGNTFRVSSGNSELA